MSRMSPSALAGGNKIPFAENSAVSIPQLNSSERAQMNFSCSTSPGNVQSKAMFSKLMSHGILAAQFECQF